MGKVMTYIQLAVLCGEQEATGIVGGITHFGDLDLPWQKVVSKEVGYSGCELGHQHALESEGYVVNNYHVDAVRLLWLQK